MGKRVHVVKKHEEYGETSAFNWKNEEFKDLLNALGCYVYEENDEGYCDRWSVETSEYENAIKSLKAFNNGEETDADADEVQKALDEMGREASIVVEIMEDYYEERDKNSGYIIFVAW